MAWQSLFCLTKPFAEASLSFVILSGEIDPLTRIDVALASWELQGFTYFQLGCSERSFFL